MEQRKQTAVEYFLDAIQLTLGNIVIDKLTEEQFVNVYYKSKAIEKEQIKDAWINGDSGLSTYSEIIAEKYYHKTYGK